MRSLHQISLCASVETTYHLLHLGRQSALLIGKHRAGLQAQSTPKLIALCKDLTVKVLSTEFVYLNEML